MTSSSSLSSCLALALEARPLRLGFFSSSSTSSASLSSFFTALDLPAGFLTGEAALSVASSSFLAPSSILAWSRSKRLRAYDGCYYGAEADGKILTLSFAASRSSFSCSSTHSSSRSLSSSSYSLNLFLLSSSRPNRAHRSCTPAIRRLSNYGLGWHAYLASLILVRA